MTARLCLLALAACSAPAPTVRTPTAPRTTDVHVDKRIELISIVMRLADSPEYQMAEASDYVADVDRVFGPFADHPAIAATRALRERHHISFDAPIELAIHLDDALQLRAAGPLDDKRWTGVDLAAYAAQLRTFAVDTHLDAFMAAHAAHYRAIEAALRTRIDAEDPIGWFDTQFGSRERARYIVVPGMLEGGANYGPHIELADGTLEMYQVLGLGNVDAHGMPAIDDEMIATLIHEMAHSYINPVFAKHRERLAHAAQQLFPRVAEKLRKQAYGNWETMLDESGVRAATVLYLRERHGDATADAATRREVENGFPWTADLAAVLQRRHARLEDAMPDVIALFERYAARP
jgi:uncharacterized protein DUF4932